jgi:hypothetical protein
MKPLSKSKAALMGVLGLIGAALFWGFVALVFWGSCIKPEIDAQRSCERSGGVWVRDDEDAGFGGEMYCDYSPQFGAP